MQSDKEVIRTLTGEVEHLIKLMKWERSQATKHREENERLREVLRKINKATMSHVNGADLLDDLHPRDEINIVVRIDGENVWHEGDWLSYLRDAVIEARAALEEKSDG